MTRTIDIDPGERGVLRLFAVDLSEPDLRRLAGPTIPGRSPGPARPFAPAAPHLLGMAALDTAHAELFDLRDLAGLGLPGYLAQAYDISRAQLAPFHDRLAALTGFVLLLDSAATPAGARLAPRPGLHFIARFETPKATVSARRLISDSGRGWGGATGPAAPPPQDGRAWRWLALAALVLLAIAGWLWLTLG